MDDFSLSLAFRPFALRVALVVQVAFELPEEGTHGLLAACLILLREERSLIGRDLAQVTRTGTDSCLYLDEAVASRGLVSAQRRGTFVRVCTEGIRTLTDRVRGSCFTVNRNKVVTVRVVLFLYGFSQCSGHRLDTTGTHS